MKRLLILGANRFYIRVMERLRDAGFHVLAVDRNADAPGRSVAHTFAAIDIVDREAVLEWSVEQRIDGILAVNDFGVRTASYVARQLGLPGLSEEAAARATDKGLMRDCWAASGLAIPEYRVVHDDDSVRTAAREVGFPCVVKPTDCGGGGRGVTVVERPQDLDAAIAAVTPYAGNHRIVVEQFIAGTEMTVETISVAGTVTVLAMSDKTKPAQTTRVATSVNYPADFPDDVLDRVAVLVKNAVAAVGIADGMAHTEVMVQPNGEPVLIELGGRGGGGHIFHTIIELVSRVNAPVETARVLCGLPVRLPAIQRRGAVYRFFDVPAGILRDYRNLDIARRVPGVVEVDIHKTRGTYVGDLRDSMYRVGYIVTAAPTRDEAVAIADEVERIVEIHVECVR